MSEPAGRSTDHSRNELIALLNIPEHLTRDVKAVGIRQYYARYKAFLEAQETLSKMLKAGTWPGRKPTVITIIELFASKSTWFTYVAPGFEVFTLGHLFRAESAWNPSSPSTPAGIFPTSPSEIEVCSKHLNLAENVLMHSH